MECEVEKIIDSDYSVNENRKLKFHIKWKGFAEKDNSWEPLENLRNCPNKIAEFLVELRQTDGVGMEAILQQIDDIGISAIVQKIDASVEHRNNEESISDTEENKENLQNSSNVHIEQSGSSTSGILREKKTAGQRIKKSNPVSNSMILGEVTQKPGVSNQNLPDGEAKASSSQPESPPAPTGSLPSQLNQCPFSPRSNEALWQFQIQLSRERNRKNQFFQDIVAANIAQMAENKDSSETDGMIKNLDNEKLFSDPQEETLKNEKRKGEKMLDESAAKRKQASSSQMSKPSTSTPPNQDADDDDHTCHENGQKICPKCRTFKFQASNRIGSFTKKSLGEFSCEFNMEVPSQIYKLLNPDWGPVSKRGPIQLKLFPKTGNITSGTSFELRTKFAKFHHEDKSLVKIDFSSSE